MEPLKRKALATLNSFWPMTWCRSMQHGGKNFPQSAQGTDLAASMILRISRRIRRCRASLRSRYFSLFA